MNKPELIKTTLLATLAAVGGAIAQALGGWDMLLQVLVVFLAVDYLTGIMVAAVFHQSKKTEGVALSSAIGFRGILKKCAILLMVFLAVMLDRATGNGFTRSAVCLFFIANEGLSILENIGLMGVPYPAFLQDMLEALRRRNDKGGE